MTTAKKDPIVTELGEAHKALVAAGKLYVGGDLPRALDELEGVAVIVADAVADLRRATQAAARREQKTELPGETFEEIFQ